MGIVQRQGLRNTIISYVGLGLGFVNTAFVLPRLLGPDQIGLTRVLVSIATIYAQLAAFGFGSVGIRFFPYFRNREVGHHGFLPLLLGLPMLGFGLATALYVLGRPLILRQYAHDAALLMPYYFWGIGLAFFTLLYSLQEAYLRALFHSSFTAFVQDILQRLLTAAAAICYGQGLIDFHQFVLAFMGLYALNSLLAALYLAYIGELHLRPSAAAWQVRPLGELLRFGGFALLSNVSGTIISSIDALMVGSAISLRATGIYTIAFFISTALTIPFRSLNKIAFPLLAQYWKDNDLPRMAAFYRSTTRLGTVLGCYLALGIGLNLDFIYALIGKPEYAAGATSVLLLLLGRLIDGITGVNGLIVVTSPRYRFDLLFNVSLAVLTVATNAWLIPRLGITGAALATLLSMTAINVARTWFVWQAYRMQPFDGRILLVLALATAAGLLAWLVPPVHSPLVTMLLRAAVLTAVYAPLVLATGVAPEARAPLQKFLARLRR
ncbi:polysaccharide biosynthesis C-terminal domain-containing protein [Hymenobacter sp. B81]|uniref:oligosaccharide flippase family protein n=1 Tax=Hymenobacter sp. B81 TaxID=3344878 RepID=UPI0037DC7905